MMPYYKTTITFYSEFDPTYMELQDLGWEAMHGSAISTNQEVTQVDPATLPEAAISFFGLMEIVDGILEGVDNDVLEGQQEDLPLD